MSEEEGSATGQFSEVWRRLRRNRAAVIGGVVVLLFIAIAILAPLIAPYDPNEGDLAQRLRSFSREHLLGTDALGRDLLSRVIYGARISLEIQIVSVSLALVIGTLLGMVGGYYGGRLDHLIMRLMDILLAFPGIFSCHRDHRRLRSRPPEPDAGGGHLFSSPVRKNRPGLHLNPEGKRVR